MGKKHTTAHEQKTDEEEITINFGWLKNIFSSKKEKYHDEKEESEQRDSNEEEISLDFGKTLKRLSKYGVIFLILIPLILSIYIRTMPERMPIAEQWARESIYRGIANQFTEQVNNEYPGLSEQTKQEEINRRTNEFINQQYAAIEQAAKQQAEGLRDSFRDQNGYTYLGDIDSYYWLRYARNILEKGTYGDEIREGREYDNHMIAPEGYGIQPNIYPYVEAYLYKFLTIFNPKLDLMQAGFYTPLFLSFFAIIAAFFIGKKLSGNLAGFMAATLIAVNPTVLSRSLGSDNDIVNAVFPLLIMLFMIYAFDSENLKKTIIYTLIGGFLIGLYSFAWSGWWFIFLLILASSGFYIGYILLFELHNNRKNIFSFFSNPTIVKTTVFLLIFLFSSYGSLYLFGRHENFITSFSSPIRLSKLKEAARGIDGWPNVYTTVAEMNEAGMSEVIRSQGNVFFFAIALIGTLLSLVKINSTNKTVRNINLLYLLGSAIYFFLLLQQAVSNTISLVVLLIMLSLPLFLGLLLSVLFKYKIDPTHSIIMVLWFIGTVYAATKGVRFILLIVPAFVISFSTFFGIMTEWLSNLFSRSLDISINVSKSILVIISLLVLIQPIQIGYATGYQYIPSINDGWVDTLTKIKLESQQNAIINSWWDFGHWFKYWADRKVTFDGASQNDPRAYWIGKVLLTDNEDEAISILKMLNCGGVKAFGLINEELNDSHKTINIFYKFFSLESEMAKKELLKVTSEEKANEIIPLLYCTPPEDYFITSQDMVGKSGVWAHFGSWDFQRAEIYTFYRSMNYNEFVNTLNEQYNFTREEAQKYYSELSSLNSDREFNDWISPWPSYGGGVSCSKGKDEMLQCNIPQPNNQVIPLQIDLNLKEAYVKSLQDTYYPNALGYFENGEYKIKKYNKNQIGYAVILLEDNQTVLLMSEELIGSMFTRLFYLNGNGIRHFKRYHDVRDITGARIITWKIEWPQ